MRSNGASGCSIAIAQALNSLSGSTSVGTRSARQRPASIAHCTRGGKIVTSCYDLIQWLDAKWITDADVSLRISKRLVLTLGADNVFNTYPTRNIATTPAVSGADTYGVFPYSELSPFGWSGAYYYGRLQVTF
ncbi:outer membrane receptor protein involved in Fe transport [Xanthomonas sacchari]|nr:outer membrane receptor protein involved in Fe transport [Xanthomonas sacchari]